jgi:hypothetical protein
LPPSLSPSLPSLHPFLVLLYFKGVCCHVKEANVARNPVQPSANTVVNWGPHSNSTQITETCWQPCEWVWKQSLFQSGPKITSTVINTVTAACEIWA